RRTLAGLHFFPAEVGIVAGRAVENRETPPGFKLLADAARLRRRIVCDKSWRGLELAHHDAEPSDRAVAVAWRFGAAARLCSDHGDQRGHLLVRQMLEDLRRHDEQRAPIDANPLANGSGKLFIARVGRD